MTLVILLSAGAAYASTVIPMSLKDLSERAGRVVVGRIEKITSSQDAASGRIQSRIEVAETRRLSGEPAGKLAFEMAGGTVGDTRQWIAGFPAFEVGDQVVLFLAETTSTPLGPTVGLWQGVFFVDQDTVKDHLKRPVAEVRGENVILAPAPGAGRVAQADGSGLKLDDFLGRVRGFRESARASGGARR